MTGMRGAVLERIKASPNPPPLPPVEAVVPLGRLGAPEEVADAVLWMSRSPYLQGSVLTLDGGMLC